MREERNQFTLSLAQIRTINSQIYGAGKKAIIIFTYFTSLIFFFVDALQCFKSDVHHFGNLCSHAHSLKSHKWLDGKRGSEVCYAATIDVLVLPESIMNLLCFPSEIAIFFIVKVLHTQTLFNCRQINGFYCDMYIGKCYGKKMVDYSGQEIEWLHRMHRLQGTVIQIFR